MSEDSSLRHQQYTSAAAGTFEVLPVGRGTSEDDAGLCERLRDVGRMLERHAIRRVILVHGTFVGRDEFGLLDLFGRWQERFPRLLGWLPDAPALRDLNRRLKEQLGGDAGAWPEQTRGLLDECLGETIEVERFEWSSENHHLARLRAAARLGRRLVELEPGPERRVLLLGHSHGGNVLALLTHLLAGNQELTRGLLEVLDEDPAATTGGAATVSARVGRFVDVVTFGTPVRYGWDPTGCRTLLHFVHHHLTAGRPRHQAAPPAGIGDLWHARHGDYVQWLGIAGTDFPPLEASAREVERRLAELLERGLPQETPSAGSGRLGRWAAEAAGVMTLLQRLQRGVRVHADGTTLLVDYGSSWSAVLGHAVYTRRPWLPFHLEEILRRLPGR